MNNICITGFMSSGKTVVSKELAKLSGRVVIDTDEMIEKELNMKINDIFSRFGEEYFRQQETRILEMALEADDAIISTGGGIVLSEYNRKIMRRNGVIVAIIPDFSVIESRIITARETRPLLREENDKIKKRFFDRLPLYRDCDVEVNPDIGDTPTEIAEYILERIK